MSTCALSHSPYLLLASNIIATIFIAGGLNAILRPAHALTFFEFEYPATSSAHRDLVDALMVVYGVRDVFMGLTLYAAGFFGEKKCLGWILVAGSGVAFVDGVACYGRGGDGTAQWGHWGYAPLLTVVGGLLVGIIDGK